MMRTLRQSYHLLPDGRIDFVFDRNQGFQATAEEMFCDLRDHSANHQGRLGDITFGAKEDFIPLQAADFHFDDAFAAGEVAASAGLGGHSKVTRESPIRSLPA